MDIFNQMDFYYQMDEVFQPAVDKGGLYLGGVVPALDVDLIQSKGIKAVLTVAQEVKVKYDEKLRITHLCLKADD